MGLNVDICHSLTLHADTKKRKRLTLRLNDPYSFRGIIDSRVGKGLEVEFPILTSAAYGYCQPARVHHAFLSRLAEIEIGDPVEAWRTVGPAAEALDSVASCHYQRVFGRAVLCLHQSAFC